VRLIAAIVVCDAILGLAQGNVCYATRLEMTPR